jgi:hypothetical protein
MTMQTVDGSAGTIPPVIEPKFVMNALNEAIPSVTDHFRVLENGALIGIVKGVLSQRWQPKPGIELRGVLETDASRKSLHGALMLEISPTWSARRFDCSLQFLKLFEEPLAEAVPFGRRRAGGLKSSPHLVP